MDSSKGPHLFVKPFLPLHEQQHEQRKFVAMHESGRTISDRTDDSLAFSAATSGGTRSDDGEACFQRHREGPAPKPNLPCTELASDGITSACAGITSASARELTVRTRNEMTLSTSQTKLQPVQQQPQYEQACDQYHYMQCGNSKSVDLLDDSGFFPDSEMSGMMLEDSYDSKHQAPSDGDSTLLDTAPSPLHNNARETTTATTPPRMTSTAVMYENGVTRNVNICQPKNGMNGHNSTNNNDRVVPDSSMTPSSAVSQSSGVWTPPLGSINSESINSINHKPVVYSAIGSLENASANSFGKIRSQFKAHNREFSRPPTAGKVLIPPQKKKQNGSVLHARFSVDSSTAPTESSPSNGGEEKKQDVSSTSHQKNITSPPSHTGGILPSVHSYETLKHSSSGTADPSLPRRKSTGALGEAAESTEGKPKRGRRKPEKVRIGASTATKSLKKKNKPLEMFRPSCDAYTPRVQKKTIKYKPAEMRTPMQSNAQNMGTLSRPNFRDALRRVAMIIKQHIVKIEQRFEGGRGGRTSDGLFRQSMMEAFAEDSFVSPKYRCTMVRLPMARPGMVYGLRKIQEKHAIPTEEEIFDFGHRLFHSVQLSSECSIVCLIYMERLMEVAMVPLVARTWKPIFMCGLLLASKVWQDLSSWNIEFASVYPQFSLDAINRLEIQFLKMIKWDLYISSSLYAKYYFALRSLLEKQDFRIRYNRMVGGVGNVAASEALKVQQRSELVKEEALLHLSRSLE